MKNSFKPKAGKKDLVREVMSVHGLDEKEAGAVVDTIFNYIKSELSAGTNMEFRGFGAFIIKKRKARLGRNAITHEVIHIPPRRVVIFKECRQLEKYLKKN